MDSSRFKIYILLICSLFLLTFLRLIFNINPIYNLIEPVTKRFDEWSINLALDTDAETDAKLVESHVNSEDEQGSSNADGKSNIDDLLVARVTRRDLAGFRKQVMIDVGRNDGVVVGQTVAVDGYLFGTIDQVYDDTALINTILDPNFRATVNIDKQPGVLKVEWGTLIVDLVPSKELDPSLVVTSGIDNKLEIGLPVGVTDAQIAEDSEVFAKYNVVLPYNVYRVAQVQVIGAER